MAKDSKPYLSLQSSEAVVAQMASTIYAAYITTGKVGDDEKPWIQRSIKEALWLAQVTDKTIQSDDEMD